MIAAPPPVPAEVTAAVIAAQEHAERQGVKTSEFWLTIATQLISLAIAGAGIFWPNLPAEELREVLLWIAAALLGTTTTAYTVGRSAVKRGILSRVAAVFR